MKRLKMRFGVLSQGFILFDGKPYLNMMHGQYNLLFPVVDGKISRKSEDLDIPPEEVIEVIALEGLEKFGIIMTETDNLMDQKFWGEYAL
ncbi:hypothetical protein HGA64_05490 [Candidatus Falkowbacteria bacterium]|nr:hypothetical protein [Candidatus Falkowbacteria bacterium]